MIFKENRISWKFLLSTKKKNIVDGSRKADKEKKKSLLGRRRDRSI